MVSQIGIGVVGGAALWLICEWLWQRIPMGALVVALAVITGLVWVVRRMRCAEDLQTTVIAVLVGLFVTVSPAALLLVSR
jgi:tellurite resistance protein TehA-like permease